MKAIGTGIGWIVSLVLSVAFAALLVLPLLALEALKIVKPVRN